VHVHVKFPYDFELKLDDPVSTHAIQFRLVPEHARVLDVGCHTAILGEALTRMKQCQVVGIDRDESVLDVARTRIADARQANVETAGWSETVKDLAPFDRILFGDVLEHTRDPLAIVKEAKDLLGPEGKVIISVPNVANLRVRMAIFLGNFDYEEAGILDWGHLRFFTRRTAREMMQEAGYEIVREAYSGYSLPAFLIKLFPQLLSVNIILVAEPKPEEEEQEEEPAAQATS
jgi:2-polyprenyl-3-methyl-5-hydroxy-6-metoxy-1,4-benzoquinol methylase